MINFVDPQFSLIIVLIGTPFDFGEPPYNRYAVSTGKTDSNLHLIAEFYLVWRSSDYCISVMWDTEIGL